MEIDGLKFHASHDLWSNEIRIYALNRAAGTYIRQVVMQEAKAEPDEMISPYMHLTMAQAQQLMNEFWQIGIRPHNGEGTNSHVEAIKYHLEDMRRLVFKNKQQGNKNNETNR